MTRCFPLLIRSVRSFGLCLLALLAHGVSAAPANIVFIFADDLGIDWLSCYGSDHPTPHLDRLAKSGVRFATAWTSPICTPSRVCMLTGLYNGRTGWTEHYDVPRWGGAGLVPERFATWPRLLREHGYTTAIAGGRSTICENLRTSCRTMAPISIACGQAWKPAIRRANTVIGILTSKSTASVPCTRENGDRRSCMITPSTSFAGIGPDITPTCARRAISSG